jgi:Ni2+-binding GTPase involved in maturation of urease and hydrogenase
MVEEDVKYFVITAGATGSGKTGLIKKTFEY